jgi:MYXO-CTERM domain-containing protein
VGALTVSTLGGGSLCVFAYARTHLIVDVLGVWSGAATPGVTPPVTVDDGDDIPPEALDAGLDGGAADPDASVPSADGGAITDGAITDGAPSDARPPTRGDASADAADGDAQIVPKDPLNVGGCGCRASGAHPSQAGFLWGAMLVVASRRRRRVARH